MTKRAVTRQAAPKSPSEEVAKRVEHVLGMMRSLEWQRGRSAVALAEMWGVSVNTVEQYAAEASRAVARELEPEELKGTLGVAMLELVKHGKPFERIKAAEVCGKIVGVFAAQRFELSTDRMRFESLPPAEQAKALREKSAECLAAAEEIERGLTKQLEA